LGWPGEHPEGFGALAGEPSVHSSRGNPRRTLGGIVAAVEHEQRHRPAGGQAAEQRADLPGGLVVGVVQGPQPGRVHRGGPGVPVQATLGDPLEGPAGDDRLAGRVPEGVVVQAALGRAFGVAARPAGHVHREHQRVGGREGAGQAGPGAARRRSVRGPGRHRRCPSRADRPAPGSGSAATGPPGRIAARRPARTAHRRGGGNRHATRPGGGRAGQRGKSASA
jgi:hypothetical protein